MAEEGSYLGTVFVGFGKATKTWDIAIRNKIAKYALMFWIWDIGYTSCICDTCWSSLINTFQVACRRLDLTVFRTEAELQPCKMGEMASTSMMTLFHLWMEYSLPLEISKRFHIVDPLWVKLASHNAKEEDILNLVPESECVFIPTLHSGHWVLWIKMRQCPTGVDAQKVSSPIDFCGPLNNPPTHILKTLGKIVIRHISCTTNNHCIISDGRYHVLHITSQPNPMGQIVDITSFKQFGCWSRSSFKDSIPMILSVWLRIEYQHWFLIRF